MSQAGFTPIQLYFSTTAAATPSAGNLANGELAINITDGKLYYKDNGGVVKLLASNAGSAGDVVGPGSSTDNALVRFDSTTGKLVQNSVGILDDSGNLTGIAALTTSGALTLSGGTANGVAFLNASKVLTTGSALTFDGTTVGVNTGVSNSTSMLLTGSYGAGGTATMLAFQRAGGAVAGALRYSDVTGSIEFGTTTNHSLLFLQNNAEAMRLTSTGLGIGTSSPAYRLDVSTALTGTAAGDNTAIALNSQASGRDVNIRLGDSVNATARIGYLSGALYMYTNGAERARITTDGFVGIRTSSPAGFLHVAPGNAAASSTNGAPIILQAQQGGSSASGGNILIGSGQNGSGGSNGYVAFGIGSATSGSAFASGEAARFTTAGNFVIGTTSVTAGTKFNVTGNNVTFTPNTAGKDTHTFSTGAADVGTYTIKNDTTVNVLLNAGGTSYFNGGNVAIGATSSSQRLLVSNSATNAEGFRVLQTTGGRTSGGALGLFYDDQAGTTQPTLQVIQNGTGDILQLFDGGAQVFTVKDGGNVGIGTSSPSAPLHVRRDQTAATYIMADNLGTANANTSSGFACAEGGAVQAFFRSLRDGSGGVQLYNVNNAALLFGTNNTERARIDSSGNLLINTTSATDRTGVTAKTVSFAGSQDAAYLTTNDNSFFAVCSHIRTTSGTRYHIGFGDGTAWTERGTISTDGTSTSYNTSSDYRLKNITGPITTSGAYIDSLNPVEGTWKADGSTFVGLIAHEVQEASRTNVATGVKDGEKMQGMDYSNSEIIANLIAEVKALRVRVAQLEAS
jgi:hypothetical protein